MRSAWKSAAIVAMRFFPGVICLWRHCFRHGEGPRWKTVQGRFRPGPGNGFKGRDNRPFAPTKTGAIASKIWLKGNTNCW